mmetsp:Transcript_5458/g.4641  ORF Transcript_5458/g.4641 Transcript_5458/m.4641 type:complete len:88 (-) Transcript_5458:113-376(-)
MFFDWFALGVQDLLKYQSVRARYDPSTTIDAGIAKTKSALGFINLLLKKKKYIASDDHPTVADYALVYHLYGVIKNSGLYLDEYEKI